MASYCAYFPDENSTLVDEVADCIAHTFNTCGFDMIYLDGSEGMRTTHAVATMKRAIFQRLHGRVLVESSSGAWGAWPFHLRVGAWDHPVYGFNRFTDLHCAGTCPLQRGRTLARAHGLVGHHRAQRGSRRHVPGGHGVLLRQVPGLGLVDVAAGGRRRPGAAQRARQQEYLTMLGQYERLRLGAYFGASVRHAGAFLTISSV